jgi:hypothetical protein
MRWGGSGREMEDLQVRCTPKTAGSAQNAVRSDSKPVPAPPTPVLKAVPRSNLPPIVCLIANHMFPSSIRISSDLSQDVLDMVARAVDLALNSTLRSRWQLLWQRCCRVHFCTQSPS